MKLGRSIYVEGVKATFCGMTTTGLVKALLAGRLQTIRASRVQWSKERTDLGKRHRKARV